jgi:replicative DNA helicase
MAKLKDEEKEEILAKLIASDPDVEVNNQYRWDEDYQRLVIGMLLTDRYFLVQSLDLVKPNYFVNEAHQLICRILFDHFDEYKVVPSKPVLVQEVRDRLAGKDGAVVLYYLGELATVYDYYREGLDSREAYLDKIVTFAKTQATKVAIHKTLGLIKKQPDTDETWSSIGELWRDALSVDKNFDIGLDYFKDLEDRYARMRQEEEHTERFTTGFEALDWGLNGGGLSRGEIGAWLGLPGTGKSLALVTASVANILRGKKVLYVSLEMDQDKLAARFDAQLADWNINRLLDNQANVIRAIREHVGDCEDKRRLVIKQFPSGTADVNTVRAYHSQLLLYGFKPDLVVVDYLGEMRDAPGIPTWESRPRLLRDLRGFGIEQQHCTLTALQPNRDAVEAQQEGYIDESKLGDSFNQNRVLDALWTINQTIKEKSACVGRVFIPKHRNGKSRYAFKIGFDYRDTCTLRMFQISNEAYLARMNEAKEEAVEEIDFEKIKATRLRQKADEGDEVPAKPKGTWEPGKNEVV